VGGRESGHRPLERGRLEAGAEPRRAGAVRRHGDQLEGRLGAITEHWNGRAWTIVPTPARGYVYLDGVSARSHDDVWAVGHDLTGRTLILHWNGTEWIRVPSQDPGTVGSELFGVTMIPGSNQAWAVGDFFAPDMTLAELFG